jgi:hypothetical protein
LKNNGKRKSSLINIKCKGLSPGGDTSIPPVPEVHKNPEHTSTHLKDIEHTQT